MQRLTNPQLREMFEMQTALNHSINPNWITANYAWTRAIRVECAELSDHIGWKWWKKQEPNWPQAHIELVDIWHFMLSSVLVDVHGDSDLAVHAMNSSLMFPHDVVIDLLTRKVKIESLRLHEKVDILSAFAAAGFTFGALFEAIMVDTGLTWAMLRRMYLAKNVLNQFRQAHGYKEGVYEKVWHGVEDNVHLERLLTNDPDMSAEKLRSALWSIYDMVPKACDMQPGSAA